MNWPTDPPIHPTTHPYTYPKVGVCPQIINLQTEFNYLDQMTIYSIFNDLTWTDPLTHPSTQPPTHPPNHPPIHLSKGGSVSTNHKSSNRLELSRLDQILLKFLWFHIFRPTNPNPPKKHPPIGGEFSTDSKSSNGIEISRFVQVLSRFYWFGGVPPLGVGGWVDGSGGGWGHPPYMCACIRICTHVHAHVHTHACMLNMINMAASMVAAICNFLTCLSSCFVCVHVCTCMCMCLGTPPMPPDAPQPICPLPRAAGSRKEPKSPKVYKSWTNRDNSILFKNSLSLNIPELI